MTTLTTQDPRDAGRDRAAAAAVERHHAEMAGRLAATVAGLVEATRLAEPVDAESSRVDLVAWCRDELLPHATAEESTLYDAARALPEGRLLVEAMLAEHRAILGLVEDLEATEEPVVAVALARALQAVFDVHLAKENDQVLPLLLAANGVSVADLLDGMHELLGGPAGEAQGTSDPDSPGLPGGGMTRGPAGARTRSAS